jgi:hypothetical protein
VPGLHGGLQDGERAFTAFCWRRVPPQRIANDLVGATNAYGRAEIPASASALVLSPHFSPVVCGNA